MSDLIPRTLTGQVAELYRRDRRRRLIGGQQTLVWEHQAFTAPATYQLTYIPYGVNVVADNGVALVHGTDYTVDYTTGLITFGVARTAGHVIYVSYVTTGELIAASSATDAGVYATDDFNRANSTTSLGSTSDGLYTWTIGRLGSGTAPVFGINSNQAYLVSGPGCFAYAYIDPGHADCIVQVDMPVSGTLATGDAGPMFRQASDGSMWFVSCISSSTDAALYRITAATIATQVGSSFVVPDGATVQAILNGSSIIIKVNGSTVVSATDSFNSTATRVGIMSDGTNPRLDNFLVTPL